MHAFARERARTRSSSSIQYEAFHVFKIFVANPHKEGRVLDVLLRNQEKLINFMRDFQTERADDQVPLTCSRLVRGILVQVIVLRILIPLHHVLLRIIISIILIILIVLVTLHGAHHRHHHSISLM